MKTIVCGQDEHVAAFVAKQIGMGGKFGSCVGIGLEEDGELIAGVVFDDYNGSNISMHVGAIPGKRWMTKEYLWYCFYYAFEEAKVKRITGVVEEENITAQKFDEHLGFELETTLKDAGRSGDLLIYRMFKEDCRFLRMKR